MKIPCGNQCICWPICKNKAYFVCRYECTIFEQFVRKLDQAFYNADYFFEICYEVKIWETMGILKEKIEINERK